MLPLLDEHPLEPRPHAAIQHHVDQAGLRVHGREQPRKLTSWLHDGDRAKLRALGRRLLRLVDQRSLSAMRARGLTRRRERPCSPAGRRGGDRRSSRRSRRLPGGIVRAGSACSGDRRRCAGLAHEVGGGVAGAIVVRIEGSDAPRARTRTLAGKLGLPKGGHAPILREPPEGRRSMTMIGPNEVLADAKKAPKRREAEGAPSSRRPGEEPRAGCRGRRRTLSRPPRRRRYKRPSRKYALPAA